MTTFMCVTCLRPFQPVLPTCCADPVGVHVRWRPDYPALNRLLAQADLSNQGLG